MKRAFVLLFLLTSAICGLAKDPETLSPDSAYFTKLRMDYAQRPDFNPIWSLDETRKAIRTAFGEKDYKKVVALSNEWLAKCPVDANTHLIHASAASRLGDMKDYVQHTYFAYGLMQSILQSGDGQTPETAYQVISVEEEYTVIGDFGAEVVGQSLIEGEKPCDKMDCKRRSGATFTVYFDVTISMKALQRDFERAKTK